MLGILDRKWDRQDEVEGSQRVPKGSDLIGLPVLAGPRMKRIGRVQEVLLIEDGSRICGLVLDGGGWFHVRRVVDYRAVKAVGEAHILAEETELEEKGRTHCSQKLFGLPVLRGDGHEVGMMDDFHFDAATGQVTLLQVSRGFVNDLLSGKGLVPLDGSMTPGEAAILLDGPGDLPGGV